MVCHHCGLIEPVKAFQIEWNVDDDVNKACVWIENNCFKHMQNSECNLCSEEFDLLLRMLIATNMVKPIMVKNCKRFPKKDSEEFKEGGGEAPRRLIAQSEFLTHFETVARESRKKRSLAKRNDEEAKTPAMKRPKRNANTK
jgi:hypothetical protein